MGMHLSEDLAVHLRPLLVVGARVAVKTSDAPLMGVFMDRVTYNDGTPGAWVELDDGPLVIAPLGDLEVRQ